ncbi:hypothetical protein JL722_10514 [Aureococcus anophagefferens]|nr:hypothetical protein JL722_10514 [Aureococcus anophagefferens]
MTSNPNSSHLVAREPSASALLDDFGAVYEKKRAPDEPRSWNPFASAKKAPPPKRRESHSADVDDEPLSPATFANNPFSLRQQAADAGGPELTADGVYGSRDPASPAAHMTANPFGAAHRKKTVDDDPTDFGDAYEKDDAAVGGENTFGAAHRKKKVKDDPTDFGDTYDKDDGAVGGENPFGAAHRKKKEQDDPTDFGGAYATDGDVAMTANPFAATHDQRKESAVPPRRGTDFHNSKADSVAMRLGKQRHKVRKSTTLQKQDVHVATADVYGEGDGGVAGANPMAKDHSPAEKLTLKLIRTSLVGSPYHGKDRKEFTTELNLEDAYDKDDGAVGGENPFGAAHRKKQVRDDPLDYGDAYDKDDAVVGGENPFGAAHRKKQVRDDPLDYGDAYDKDDGAVGGENPFGAAHRKKQVRDDPLDYGDAYDTKDDDGAVGGENPFGAAHRKKRVEDDPTDYGDAYEEQHARLGMANPMGSRPPHETGYEYESSFYDRVYGSPDGVGGANPMGGDDGVLDTLSAVEQEEMVAGTSSPWHTFAMVLQHARDVLEEGAAKLDAAYARAKPRGARRRGKKGESFEVFSGRTNSDRFGDRRGKWYHRCARPCAARAAVEVGASALDSFDPHALDVARGLDDYDMRERLRVIFRSYGMRGALGLDRGDRRRLSELGHSLRRGAARVLESFAATLEKALGTSTSESPLLLDLALDVRLVALRGRVAMRRRGFDPSDLAHEGEAWSSGLAPSVTGLGNALLKSGRPRAALEAHGVALAVKRDDADAAHAALKAAQRTAVAGSALHERAATAEAASGHHESAVRVRALDVRTGVHGPDHPDVANTLWCRGRAKHRSGDDGGALADFKAVLAIRLATLGPSHPAVATCQTQLAVVHLAAGEHREAAALYDAARAIREARFGPGHPACGSSALAAAEIHGFLGDHERASMLYAVAYHSFYKAGPHYRYRANKAWLRCRYESLLRAVSKKPVDDRSWEGLATDAADGAVAVDPDPNFDEFAVEDEGGAVEDDGGAITPATPQVDAEDL